MLFSLNKGNVELLPGTVFPFTLQFPKVQRTDTAYPQRMLKPDESQFTSYAEQELIKAVKNFVSIKETFESQHVLFDHVSMRIMEDTNSLTH